MVVCFSTIHKEMGLIFIGPSTCQISNLGTRLIWEHGSYMPSKCCHFSSSFCSFCLILQVLPRSFCPFCLFGYKHFYLRAFFSRSGDPGFGWRNLKKRKEIEGRKEIEWRKSRVHFIHYYGHKTEQILPRVLRRVSSQVAPKKLRKWRLIYDIRVYAIYALVSRISRISRMLPYK